MDHAVAVARNIPLNLFKNNEPLPVTVVESRLLTAPGPSEVRHIVLQWQPGQFRFLEGQSAGIPPPGLNARGRPNVPRLYSIASPRTGEDGTGTTLALTVKRLVYVDEAGVERHGLSSNHLCDARVGDVLTMTGPAGKEFLLPENPRQNLVLIATGTGIAPFRAFVQRRHAVTAPGERGQTWLFFGVQRAAELLYRQEWDKFALEQDFRVDYALSREQVTADGRRMYVQDRMLQAGAALWTLLTQPDTSVFICGLKGMEFGIDDALGQLAFQHGGEWGVLLAQMRAEERWHVEVY